MSTKPSNDLRVAVVGAGMMGADHIERITKRISGAVVTAIVDPSETTVQAAAKLAPEARTFSSFETALDSCDVDAVLIASPGPFHEDTLVTALGEGLPILCEKPLTFDAESSLRVLEAEQKQDRPLIQVGFMRRFDAEYVQLRALRESGDAGALLALHCAHRNPRVDEFSDSRMITDSVVHEVDIIPWIAGSPIRSVEVRFPRVNTLAPAGLRDPQIVMFETESGVLAIVEMNVNVRFGYQVTTDAVFEHAVAEAGRTNGLTIFRDAKIAHAEHQDFRTRFGPAYDEQVQRWVHAAHQKTIDGPSAWDGYIANAVCEAGVQAQSTAARVEVESVPRPDFYA